MRRFVTLALILVFSIPVGISISGCSKSAPVEFCNGGSTGMVIGQITTINLEPRLYGISLNFGSVGQISTPSALDCKGNAVGVVRYTYGTTNITYADVSPSGALCAGSWNRNSPGGVPDYTTCTPPSAAAQAAAPIPAAYVTTSAGGAVSNPVPIYVHPAVSSIVLQPQSSCLSQGTTVPLTANVYSSTGADITSAVGPLYFSAQDSTVVSINSTVFPPLATAQMPGSTILTAATSNSTSSSTSGASGIFYTCPPKSITLSVPGASSTSINLNLNTPQALVASILDTNNNSITGLSLEYLSTSPRSVNAGSTGSVYATYPGFGAITAICQPPSCNNAPLNQLGVNGNGLPVASNPIQVATPGTVNTVLYMASTGSQYFNSVDFQTGQIGTPVRLPYVPNSMLSDQAGQTLFFGSLSELMEVSATSNTLVKEDASVKGNVVGVSNDGAIVVISDSIHQLIYIYNVSATTSTSFGGTATHAVFSPDDAYVYITGSDSTGDVFFVYSGYTGWHAFTPALLGGATPVDVALTVPSIGAYLAGATTHAVGYCSTGTPPVAANQFFPLADSKAVATDRISATFNGQHILGAAASTKQLVDLSLTLPTLGGPSNPGACPSAGYTFTTVPHTVALGVTPATITGVIPSADSSVAFVTYTTAGTGTTGTLLPAYKPAASGAGTLSSVTLSNGAGAPVSGIFSPDGQTFYTGTSADNLVHLINVPALTDTKTVAPSLPACASEDLNTGLCTTTGTTTAVPNLLSDRPRPTT